MRYDRGCADPLNGLPQERDVPREHVQHRIRRTGDGARLDDFRDLLQIPLHFGGRGMALAVHLHELLGPPAQPLGTEERGEPELLQRQPGGRAAA